MFNRLISALGLSLLVTLLLTCACFFWYVSTNLLIVEHDVIRSIACLTPFIGSSLVLWIFVRTYQDSLTINYLLPARYQWVG